MSNIFTGSCLYYSGKVSHSFVKLHYYLVIRPFLTGIYMSCSKGPIKGVLYITSYDEMGVFEQRVYFLCADVSHFLQHFSPLSKSVAISIQKAES